jgi:hypothetical protein
VADRQGPLPIRRPRGRPRGSRTRNRGDRSRKSAADGGDGDGPDSDSPKSLKSKIPADRKCALSVVEFCALYSISPGLLYKLRKEGRGPVMSQVGKRRLILAEDGREWFRQFRQPDPINNNSEPAV